MHPRLQLPPLFLAIALLLLTAPLPAAPLTHTFDMETPLDWSGVNMEWGSGGVIDFAYEEPGKPGKALHLTTVPVDDPAEACANFARGQGIVNEGRTLQINHQPGTRATISFDWRVLQFPEGTNGWFTVAYYDGYVFAEFFQENLDDPYYDIPAPFVRWNADATETDWQHVEVTTDILSERVLTLWITAANATKPGPIDIAIDNLVITVEPQEDYVHPGFDWSDDMDTIGHCRRGDGCRHLAWCDVYYDETAPHGPDSEETIHFGAMTIFRLTSGNPAPLAMKHDLWHRRREGQAGGRSVIGLASIHGADAAKSFGIRQTVSWEHWGLRPGQRAKVTVHSKGASVFAKSDEGYTGRTLLGADPTGGINSHAPEVLWTEEGHATVYEKWHLHTIQFEKPVNSKALTLYVKWRDGFPDDTCDDAAPNGNTGWFDYVDVEVEPMEE